MEFVGRYRIEARIGEGAMADVYRAHDPSIDRTLAIKVLKAELRGDPEIVERFLREARAAGALSHPNIVTIYDVGQAGDYPYIAMELLQGVPLDEQIRGHGRMPVETVIRVAAQIARALDYAHAAGVIHRDIKPSNIMLCDGGRTAKILDFGIARREESDRLRAEVNALRTQIGQILGTPRYMSPEQALGQPVDSRSDLFSLGVVLYEMLTGQTAFGGTSIATLALQITQAQPQPLAQVRADCPRGLAYVVNKLLAKQPDKRFATGASLADALQHELDALGSARHGRTFSLQSRLTLVMGAATVLALIASIFVVLDRQHKTMENMALTSGDAIAAFVSNNVALKMVDNAGLPPDRQDWLPIQAFVAAASGDAGVRRITIVDGSGVVRGASDPARVGRHEAPPRGERLVAGDAHQEIFETADGDLKVRRMITYAGRPFGKVELVISSDRLNAALENARNLLLGLAGALLLVVLVISYATAHMIARPLHQLRRALADAAAGKRDFRISHRRRDEFGELFDSFNALVESLENAPAAVPAELPAQAEAADVAVLHRRSA